MNLTPLLLASRITKMVSPPLAPNMFSNLLPRDLGWLTHAHARIGQGTVSIRRFGVNADSFAKEPDLSD